MDNASQLQESDLLDIVRASEAIVYAVGVRSREGVYLRGRRPTNSWSQRAGRFLERLTESTGGQVWFADSSADLKEAYLDILAEMETRYLLSYQPEGAQEQGWHEIKVKLKGRKAGAVRARSGYLFTPPIE
jgi:VWFA-related protein